MRAIHASQEISSGQNFFFVSEKISFFAGKNLMGKNSLAKAACD